MQTLKFQAQIGDDGILKIELPLFRGETLEAVLVVENGVKITASRYPEGWFEATWNAWQGEFAEIESLPAQVREEIFG